MRFDFDGSAATTRVLARQVSDGSGAQPPTRDDHHGDEVDGAKLKLKRELERVGFSISSAPPAVLSINRNQQGPLRDAKRNYGGEEEGNCDR